MVKSLSSLISVQDTGYISKIGWLNSFKFIQTEKVYEKSTSYLAWSFKKWLLVCRTYNQLSKMILQRSMP